MPHNPITMAFRLTGVAIALVSALSIRAEAGRYAQNPASAGATLPSGEGSDIARRRCLTCHGVELIAQQRLSRDDWSRELEKMAAWGAQVPAEERPLLLDFLTGQLGNARPPSMPNTTAADLIKMRCHVCHDRTLIDQQRLSVAGWRRELDKMVGWGARVTEAEKAILAEHLASQ
jgi:cytochrome c5